MKIPAAPFCSSCLSPLCFSFEIISHQTLPSSKISWYVLKLPHRYRTLLSSDYAYLTIHSSLHLLNPYHIQNYLNNARRSYFCAMQILTNVSDAETEIALHVARAWFFLSLFCSGTGKRSTNSWFRECFIRDLFVFSELFTCHAKREVGVRSGYFSTIR